MSYIQQFGFDADPFAKTNADEEERLSEYFIPPPFFTAVFGDYLTPKSSLVFAPRGNGKTALKRRIELSSQETALLCITYNEFDVNNKKLAQIDLEYHLRNIVKLTLVAVITAIQNKVDALADDDRHLIYLFTKEYF
jgi:hypothetical protein